MEPITPDTYARLSFFVEPERLEGVSEEEGQQMLTWYLDCVRYDADVEEGVV